MELHEKIKNLRKERQLTQHDVGQILGVSDMSVRNWENGSKAPSANSLAAIAKLYEVSSDYLLGISAETPVLNKRERNLLSEFRSLDFYGKLAVEAVCAIEQERVETKHKRAKDITSMMANAPTRYIPRYILPSAAGSSAPIDGDDFELIPVEDNVPTSADFAVRIQGSSMYPYISDGETVYVQKNCTLSNGDVGIFSVNGSMYCKQYYLDEERNLTLVSANPDLKDTNVYVSADSSVSVKCFGRVLLGQKIELPNYLFE